MASTFVMSGANKGDYYPLGRRTNVIGRDEGLLVQVLDPMVSRKHMRIRYNKENNHYLADDLDSKHGTFINGRRIIDETILREGDQIGIGKTHILFTTRDFSDNDSALNHFKKAGERIRDTLVE